MRYYQIIVVLMAVVMVTVSAKGGRRGGRAGRRTREPRCLMEYGACTEGRMTVTFSNNTIVKKPCPREPTVEVDCVASKVYETKSCQVNVTVDITVCGSGEADANYTVSKMVTAVEGQTCDKQNKDNLASCASVVPMNAKQAKAATADSVDKPKTKKNKRKKNRKAGKAGKQKNKARGERTRKSKLNKRRGQKGGKRRM